MITLRGNLELSLRNNQPLVLHPSPGTRLTARCGVLWITGGGLVGDHYLALGESLILPGKARCLIEPIGCPQASLRIQVQGRSWRPLSFSGWLVRLWRKAGKWWSAGLPALG